MTSLNQELATFKYLLESKVLTNQAWKKFFPIIVSKGISTVSTLVDTNEEIIDGFKDIPEVPREKLKKFRQDIIDIRFENDESFSVSLYNNDLFKQFQFIPQLNIRNYLQHLSSSDQSNQIDRAIKYVDRIRKTNPRSMPPTNQQATLITFYCQEPPSDRLNSFYSLINRNLRERNPQIFSYQSALYVLDSAIRSLPTLERNTITWRGVNYPPDLKKFYVENTVCFSGICSTSLRKDTTISFMELEPANGEHKRTLFKLFMINGKSICLWSPLKHECEVITNLCSRWKVLKVEHDHEEDFGPSLSSYHCDYYIELQEIEGEILFLESTPENCLSGLRLLVEVDHQSIGEHFQRDFRDFFTLLRDDRAKRILEDVLVGYWDSDQQQFFAGINTNKAKDRLQNFLAGLASLHIRLIERSIEIENALHICEKNKIYSWIELQGAGARKRTLADLQQFGFSAEDTSKIHQETKEDQMLHDLYRRLGFSGDFDNPNVESDFETTKQLIHYVMREGGAVSLYRIAQVLTDGLQFALRRNFSATLLRIPGRFGFALQRTDIYIATAMLAVHLGSYALCLWYGDITLRQFVKKSVLGLITIGGGLIGIILATIICPVAGVPVILGGLVGGAILSVSFHAAFQRLLDKWFPDSQKEELNAMRRIYYQALASLDCLPSNSMSEIRTRYYELALQTDPDKHPEDVNGATERFQRLVAEYAIIQAYYEVLEDACKDLNLNVATLTFDEVRAWKKLHKDIVSKSEKKCDERTRKIRKSFRIVYRHMAFSNQTSFRWLRRFLNDDKRETICKKKPTQSQIVTHDNQS